MKTILRSALLIGALVSFASCATPEQPKVEGEGTPVSLFVEGIATKADTDLQATAFSGGENVGVFVTGVAENGDNNLHTVGEDGSLTTENQIVYPADPVNIYAYAPYTEGATTTTKLQFAVNADQSVDANYIASDLLYASKEGVAASASPVGLIFTHKMSKVILNVKANTAINLDAADVTLKNVATTVSLDLTSGEATPGATKADVKVATGKGEYAALIAPQTIGAAETITPFVTVGNYTASFSDAFTFVAGKVYTFNVTIDKAATISVSTITDWDDDTDDQDFTIVD